MSTLDNLHSTAVSVIRLGRGWTAAERGPAPQLRLELYEFEGCPYCRKVREVLTELDLAYVCRPCPKGSNNRKQVVERGGNAMFPYLVDPNTGRAMYESEAIITYLMQAYGTGRSGWSQALAPINTAGAAVASVSRPFGRRAVEGAADREQPPQLLELYNFEASPFCRKVRENLHELNLDFVVHNVGKRSPRREELVARGGKMMVPYLIDPNTQTEMYESDDIIAYLQATYVG